MSSYLSIYIVPKRKSVREQKQHIILAAYSRNSDIYQYFNENINPVFIGNAEETPYTVITKQGINSVLNAFDEDIDSAKNRLAEYEKYAAKNPEYIQEIINLKEHITELQYYRDKTSFIEDVLSDAEIYDAIEEVCCNID